LKIDIPDDKIKDDVVQSSLNRLTKELQQSRNQIEDLQREKIKQLERIQILGLNDHVPRRDGRSRRDRRVNVGKGVGTQMLVQRLGLEVETLKRELMGREKRWSVLQDSYKSLREERDRVNSKNVALSKKVRCLEQLRRSDSVEHEAIYQKMKTQMEQVNRNNVNANESIIVKCRIIEDQRRKYVK